MTIFRVCPVCATPWPKKTATPNTVRCINPSCQAVVTITVVTPPKVPR